MIRNTKLATERRTVLFSLGTFPTLSVFRKMPELGGSGGGGDRELEGRGGAGFENHPPQWSKRTSLTTPSAAQTYPLAFRSTEPNRNPERTRERRAMGMGGKPKDGPGTNTELRSLSVFRVSPPICFFTGSLIQCGEVGRMGSFRFPA